MKVDEFVASYSSEYMLVFYGEQILKDEVLEGERKPKKSALSRISDFLIKPRYEVNNLKFSAV